MMWCAANDKLYWQRADCQSATVSRQSAPRRQDVACITTTNMKSALHERPGRTQKATHKLPRPEDIMATQHRLKHAHLLFTRTARHNEVPCDYAEE